MTFKNFRLKYKIPMIIGGVSLFVGVITTLAMSNIIGNQASTANNQILQNNEEIKKASENHSVNKKENKDVTRSGISEIFSPINVNGTLANRFIVPNENINMSINNAISSQSTNTNITFDASNNAVAFSNYDFTMPIYKYANHHPLNENLNDFNNRTNEYIGYQVYNNNGIDISKNDYGFTINDRFEKVYASINNQSEPRDFIISQFSGSPLKLNNGDISIFAMEYPGSSGAYGNSTITLPPALVVNNSITAKAPYITNISNFQEDNKTIFNKFFFNLLIANRDGTNAFFAPTESMQAVVKFNGSTDGNLSTNQSAVDFVKDLNNRNRFSVDVTQAINHTNDYFTLELIPRTATVDVNLTIKNYVEVEKVFVQDSNNNSTSKNIYSIVPSKTFENVLTLRGFAPAKTVNIAGDDITSIYDDKTTNNSILLGKATNDTSIGIGGGILNQYNSSDIGAPPDWTGVWDYRKEYPSHLNKQPRLNNAIVPLASFNKSIRPNTSIYGNAGIFDKENIWANNVTDNNAIWAMPYYFDQLLYENRYNNKLSGQRIRYYNGAFNQSVASSISSSDIGNWAFATQSSVFGGVSSFMSLGTTQLLQTAGNYTMESLGRTNSNSINGSQQSLPILLNFRVRNDSVKSSNPVIKQMMYLTNDGTPITNIDYGTGKYGSYFAANNNDPNAIFEYLCGVISTNYKTMESYWMTPSGRTSITPFANGGIEESSISSSSPSQWIQSQDNIKKIKINVNNGIVETVQSMSIALSPNDANGTLKVSVTPGNGVNVNQDIFPHNGNVAEVEAFSPQSFTFTISGFSTDSNVQNTQIQSPNNWNITTLPEFSNAYITYGIDNYLDNNQTISNLVMSRQEEILANAISDNYRNLYNVRTNEFLLPFENGAPSSALLSQVRNIAITIPSNISNTGYNYLNLTFDLQGIASNGVIDTTYQPQTIKIMFKEPDRVSTYFNNNVTVYDPKTEQLKNPYLNPVADNILNTILDPSHTYTNKYPLFNYLVSGYWDINNYWKQDTNNQAPLVQQVNYGQISNFKITIPDIDVNNPSNTNPDIVANIPFLRSQWVLGYPSDYYLAYNGRNNILATSDELSPSNWNFSAPTINSDGILNFSLSLPYVVNNQGLIVKSNVTSQRSISGYSLNKNLNTLLTQSLFNSPVNTLLPSQWMDIQEQLITPVQQTISALPAGSTITLVPETISNLNGTISFNVYPSSYFINGIKYTNTNNNRSLGVVTFHGFQHAQVTSVRSIFRASSFIDVNNNQVLPSNLSPSSITEVQLMKILENDGFVNLPPNTTVSITNFSEIQISGINGEIVINPTTAGLTINQYFNENGLLVSTPPFIWPQSIVISGFQQSQPTNLSSQNYQLTNNDQPLATFSETQAKAIAFNLLENLPRNFSIDTDMQILEFKKYYNNIPGDASSPSIEQANTVTFKIELINYYDDNGNLATTPKIFPIFSPDNPNQGNPNITISGFKNIGATIVSGSYTISDFSTKIASNYVANFAITDADIRDKIINFIFPLVNNAPDDLLIGDLSLGQVQTVNNIDGSIRVTVLSTKAYNERGELSSSTRNLIGDVTFAGFKKLPSSPTEALNNTNNQFSVNLTTTAPDENFTDSMIVQLLYNNLGLFTKNTPPILTNVQPSIDNPQIKLSNLHISNVIRNLTTGSIAADVKLSSYYATQNNVNGVVWISTTTPTAYLNIGKVTINGFKQYQKTDINTNIDVRNLVPVNPIQDKLPSDVSVEEIRKLIKENAIVNPPNGLLDSEIVISRRQNNNLSGVITVSISLTRYINDIGDEITGSLPAEISIIGFKSVRPTAIASSIQTPDTNLFAYEYDQTSNWATVRNLILNNIDSPAANTTIDNIILDTAPVINNFTGTITIFRPQLNRYYDSNGTLATTNQVFNDITIFGFKTVLQATSIISEFNMQSTTSSLPIEYFDFLTDLSNPTTIITNKLKQLILDNNFIRGIPDNFSFSDFDLTIREINNISGIARITINLKRYFNSAGQLVDVNKQPNADFLSQNILLSNFASIIETDLRDTIEANLVTEMLPSDFIEDNNNVALKNLIFNRAIIGRWSAFTQNDFAIKNKVANNLLGIATIDVEFKKFIDANGIYHDVVNSGQEGLIKQITITGLKQAQQTRISENISYYLNAPTIPEFFVENEANLKKYIFDNLIINKMIGMTTDDIEIEPRIAPDGTQSFGEFDNLTGTVKLQARLINNYYNDNGVPVTDGTKSSLYNVTIILDETTIPTSIISSQNISDYSSMIDGNDIAWSSKSASEFASTDSNSIFLKAVEDKLFNVVDFVNNNQSYGDIGANNVTIPYNYQNMILRNIPFFKNISGDVVHSLQQNDISYRQQTAANGILYYGTPNNVDGTLTLTIRLTRYYNAIGELVETSLVGNQKPVLELNTVLTGFRKTTDKPVEIVNITKENNSLSSMTANEASTNLNSNSALANLIIDKGIKNWSSNNKNNNFSITGITSVDNINGTLVIDFRIRDFVDEFGLNYSDWSKNYSILISGFRDTKPTSLVSNLTLNGVAVNPELVNLDKNIEYRSINLFELATSNPPNRVNNWIYQVVHSNLSNLVINQTTAIEQLTNNSFNLDNMLQYITINNINFDYGRGIVDFDFLLYSYYSNNNGELVEQSTPLVTHMYLSGFHQNVPTTIIPMIDTSLLADTFASDWAVAHSDPLRRFIINNQNLFFVNQPYNLRIFDIDVNDVTADALFGSLSFKLSLSNYFNFAGDIASTPRLEQTVVLSGFKRTAETEVTSTVNLRDYPANASGSLDRSLERLTTNNIRNFIFSYKDFPSAPIINNIPPNFSEGNILDLTFTPNYNLGQALVEFKLNNYYDIHGNQITTAPKAFSLRIVGFSIVNEITSISSTVDISATPLAGEIATNIDDDNIKEYFSRNPSLLTSMVQNLPLVFDNNPLGSNPDFKVSILANSADPANGILTIKLDIYKYFDNVNGSIVLVDDISKPLSKEVKLTGFRQVKPTEINNNVWNLSIAGASDVTVGTMDSELLTRYVDAQNIKSLYVDNPVRANNIITTEIHVSEITTRDVGKGTLEAKIFMTNYYDVQGRPQSTPSAEKLITFTGFKPQPPYFGIQASARFNLAGESNLPIASIYAQNTTNIMGYLNAKVNNIPRIVTMIANALGSNDSRQPQVTEIVGIDGGNQIFVDDESGEVKFQVKVINMINENGILITSPEILKDENGKAITVTFSGLPQCSPTTWKNKDIAYSNNINLSSSSTVQNFVPNEAFLKEQIIMMINPGVQGLQKQSFTPNEITIDALNKIENEKSGIVSYKIDISNWWNITTNDNQYSEFTSDSRILVTGQSHESNINIIGLNTFNADTQNFLFIFSISAASVILFVLLVMVGYLIYRKWRVN